MRRSPGARCGEPRMTLGMTSFSSTPREPTVGDMQTTPASPVDHMLTASVLLAQATTLASTVLFAARGWDDATAGAVQVIAGVLDFLLVVRLVTWLDYAPCVAAAALGIGALGAAGWVAYGVNTIKRRWATPIWPTPPAPPPSSNRSACAGRVLLIVGGTLLLTRRVPIGSGAAITAAGLLLPISRIGNIWQLAIIVDVLLLVGLLTAAAELRDPDTADPARFQTSTAK